MFKHALSDNGFFHYGERVTEEIIKEGKWVELDDNDDHDDDDDDDHDDNWKQSEKSSTQTTAE